MLSDAYINKISTRIVSDGFGDHVGFQIDHVGEDHSRLRLPWRAVIQNAGGIVHGGAISALVDTAATVAAWATPNAANPPRGTTVGFSINFLQPGRDSDLIAVAHVIQRGGHLSIIDVQVENEIGQMIAKAQVTYKITLTR